MAINLNCDMGESFGIYRLGNDEAMMPYLTYANIACGFHGSDPNHMEATVRLAKEHGVGAGAHFSLPDLQGFGRREMKITRAEMRNMIVYQVGALEGFLNAQKSAMTHLKPHGSLYGMAAKYEHIAHAIADVALLFELPVMGMSNSLQEDIYTSRGVAMIAEFYADLEYGDGGELIITREHKTIAPEIVVQRCRKALEEGKASSINGIDIDIRVDTICVHSDTENSIELARAISSLNT